MTRINSAVSIKKLTDEHLLAEFHEITRLPVYYKRALMSGSINKIPSEFCLGTDHVLFFLNKFKFIKDRYSLLLDELKCRGYSLKDLSNLFDEIPEELCNDYSPTLTEHSILVERIIERINFSTKKYWHYYRLAITKEQAINLLTNN